MNKKVEFKKVELLGHKDVSTLLPLRKYDTFVLDGKHKRILKIEKHYIHFDDNTGMSQSQLLTYMRHWPDKYYMTERWEEKDK